MEAKVFTSNFNHLYSDGIPSEQPANTYVFAGNAEKSQGALSQFFLCIEKSNELCAVMPDNSNVRGAYHLEERDWFIVLNYTGNGAEIGVFDYGRKEYRTVVKDADLDCPLDIEPCEYYDIATNVHNNCNRIKIHYSDKNDIYRVIDITDPCCEKGGSLNDTKLVKCVCIPTLKVSVIDGLGYLEAGTYSASLMVYDEDGNTSNYSVATNGITISEGSNRIAEPTNKAIVFEASGIPEDYSFGELVIFEQVQGKIRERVISDIGFGNDVFKFTYTGKEGTYQEGIGKEVRKRRRYDIKGNKIKEHNGAAIFADLQPERNWNVQKIANRIQWRWYSAWVPADEAHHYKSFRKNEFIIPAIWFNFKDGRRTRAGVGINDNYVTPEMVTTCDGCQLPNWFVTDTSTIEHQESLPGLANRAARRTTTKQNYKFRLSNRPGERIASKENPLTVKYQKNNKGCKCYNCGNVFQKCLKQVMIASLCIANLILSGWDDFMNFIDANQNDDTDGGDENNTGSTGPKQFEIPATDGSDCCQELYDCMDSSLEENNQYIDTISSEYSQTKDEVDEVFSDVDNNNTQGQNKGSFSKRSSKAGDCRAKEGDVRVNGHFNYQFKNGKWHHINNATVYEQFETAAPGTRNQDIPADHRVSGGEDESKLLGDESNGDCIPELTKPIFHATGKFGYGESEETYPETISRAEEDDCQPFFEEYAGQRVRLFRIPSSTKVGHFYSNGDNVPSGLNPGNDLRDETWVLITGIRAENILIPPELRDQLCEKEPFTIGVPPRTEADKSVISSGVLHGTFEGDVFGGNPHLFPKHNVNSFEFYDPTVRPSATNTFRRGRASTIPAYLYHSPDALLYGNKSRAQFAFIELEMYGEGIRYGMYAQGTEPKGFFQTRVNQAGARSGINLNHYRPFQPDTPLFRCIKAMDMAKENSTVPANGKFTLPLINQNRESGQYVEFFGAKADMNFNQDAFGEYGSTNGTDRQSDNSFIGDGIDHFSLIGNARAHYVTMMRFIPRMYGSVVNMGFVPIGLSGQEQDYATAVKVDDETGELVSNPVTVEGLVGDSYVGSYVYKRHSVVTDKVPEEISPQVDFSTGGSLEVALILLSIGALFFAPIVSIFILLLTVGARAFNIEECGTIPNSGDTNDIRNSASLRENMRGVNNTDLSQVTITAPSSDYWYPSVTSAYIHSVYCSDANLKYRGTGVVSLKADEDRPDNIAEVEFFNLKSLSVDSSWPNGKDWRYTWMNRIYKKLEEHSSFKIMGKYILLFIWVFVPAFIITFYAARIIAEAYNNQVVGVTNSVGFALTLIVAAVFIGMAIIWVNFWAGDDFDNRVVSSMLKMDNCFPHLKNSSGDEEGSPYAMKVGKYLRGLEDNFFFYNPDLVFTNWREITFSMPLHYDTEWCPKEYQPMAISSARQNPNSAINAWRNVNPFYMAEIPRTRGPITDIISMQNRLAIQTTESIFPVRYNPNRLNVTGDRLPLSSRNVFEGVAGLFGGVEEGYGGTKDPNASITTAYGHFFIDSDARRLRIFTGGGLKDQQFTGLDEFFDKNMGFKVLETWPDFPIRDQKCEGGIHYDIWIDYTKSLVYLYKKDYKLKPSINKQESGWCDNDKKIDGVDDLQYYEDNSFVVSFDLNTRKFKSFHYWRPEQTMFNRHHAFYIKDGKIYDSFTCNKFGNFFGVQMPTFIDAVVQVPSQYGYVSEMLKIKILGDIFEYNSDGTKLEIDEPIIDKVMVYNCRQSTGWIETEDYEIIQEDATEDQDNKPWEKKTNGLVVNLLENQVEGEVFSQYNPELEVMDVSDDNSCEPNGKLIDDWVGVRMYIKKRENVNVCIRRVMVFAKENKMY